MRDEFVDGPLGDGLADTVERQIVKSLEAHGRLAHVEPHAGSPELGLKPPRQACRRPGFEPISIGRTAFIEMIVPPFAGLDNT